MPMPTSVRAETPLDERAMRSVTYWPLSDGVTVAALADGYFQTAMGDAVRRLDPAEAERLHRGRARRTPPRITHMNYALLSPGAPTTLVDAGMGNDFGDSVGHLPVALAAAGIEPDDVGLVLLTHLHLDHAAGLLTEDGRRRYEHATVVVDPAEAAYWTDPRAREGASDDLTAWFDGAARVLDAYADHLAAPAHLPGLSPVSIEPVPLAGHTPGHTGYRVRDGQRSLTFVGDLVHLPTVQGPRPDACMVFDVDEEAAWRTRVDFLRRAARTGELVAGGHTEYPGLVTVSETGGDRFELVPALWADRL